MRFAGQGLREKDSLSLPSTKLVRIRGIDTVSLWEAHSGDPRSRFRAATPPSPISVSVNNLNDLLADAHHGT